MFYFSGRFAKEDIAKEVGANIFNHLQVIEYYRYLKVYDESCKSIFISPDPLEPKLTDASDQPEPELKVKFLKDWEQEKARENTKNWSLDAEGDKISKTRFIELFSLHCMDSESEGMTFGPGVFYNIQVHYIVFIVS